MAEYEYIDSNGQQQGPYDEETITKWIEEKLFPANIKIRAANQTPPETFKAAGETDSFRHFFEPQPVSESPTEAKTHIGSKHAIGPPPASKELHWLYIDQENKIQGPFANSLMHRWYKEGNLNDSLKVQKYYLPVGTMTINPKNIILSNYKSIGEIENCEFLKTHEDKSKLKWFYLDDDNVERGPFSAEVMLAWLQRGFIGPNRKVRSDINSDFKEIGGLDKPFGNEIETPSLNYSGKNSPNQVANSLQKNEKMPPQTQNRKSQWFYIDLDNNRPQGPFSEDAMAQWHKEGFLPDFVQVRRAEESQFFPIRNRIAVGDCPFVFPQGAVPQFSHFIPQGGPFLGPNMAFVPNMAPQHLVIMPNNASLPGFGQNIPNFQNFQNMANSAPKYPHFPENGVKRPSTILNASVAGTGKKPAKSIANEMEERKRVADSMAKLSQTLANVD